MHDYSAIECPDWFTEWVADYVVALGVGDDFGDVMLRRWWPAFAAANYSPAELAEALQRLLASPPERPRDHLPAVNAAVAALRAARRAAESPPAESPCEGQPCYACGWVGVVIVPHPADMKSGEWVAPFRTGTVFCLKCGPGRRKFEAAYSKHQEKLVPTPLSLESYELRVTPQWRELLAEHAEREKLMQRAQEATERVGAAHPAGEAVKRFLAGVGTR